MKLFTTSMMCVDMFLLQEQFPIIDQHTDLYHVDMMDGHFVPNLALSFDFIKQLRDRTEKAIDVHLMMEHPGDYIDKLILLGVNYITLHLTTIENETFRLIDKIKSSGIKLGIALRPIDDISTIKYLENKIDKVTVMTVEPGFAGQKAIDQAVKKIKTVFDYRQKNHLNFKIEVDGSNNYETFKTYYDYGADIFVLGSTLFKTNDLDQSYRDIKTFVEHLNE